MRDIGKAGEDFFSSWCAISGITANKSDNDKNGWDIFLEIDHRLDITDPAKLHEGITECKVQIKSTDRNSLYVDVELSNLHKMVTTPLPSFYILIAFDKSNQPKRVYVRHVDDDLIRETLKRIRQITSENKNVKLNKKNMRVKFSDEILPFQTDILNNTIQKMIGSSYSKYLDKKRELLGSVGYENGAHKMTFNLRSSEDIELLIKAALGEKTKVNVENVMGFSTRFGFETPLEAMSSPSAVLEILNVLPDDKGTLTFKEKDSGHTLKFNADVYTGFNKILPLNHRAIRISGDFFEIVLKPNKQSFQMTFNIDIKKSHPFTIIRKIYSFVEMLNNSRNVELTMNFFNIPVKLVLDSANGLDDSTTEIELCEKVSALQQYFHNYDEILVSIEELIYQKSSIDSIYSFFIGSPSKGRLRFESVDSFLIDSVVHCLVVISAKVGNFIFMNLVCFETVIVDSSNEDMTAEINSYTSIYKTVLSLEINDLEIFESDLKSAVNRFIESGKYNVVDFTNSFIQQFKENFLDPVKKFTI